MQFSYEREREREKGKEKQWKNLKNFSFVEASKGC
jgi:hypothetical protein